MSQHDETIVQQRRSVEEEKRETKPKTNGCPNFHSLQSSGLA